MVWINRDLVPHTVSAKDRAFDSGGIAARKTWMFKATKRGTIPYICTFHPGMQGTLVVR